MVDGMTVRLRFPSKPSRKQTLWGLLGLAAAGVVAFVGSRFLGGTDAAPSDGTDDEQATEAADASGGRDQA